jgi:hypothetical protein
MADGQEQFAGGLENGAEELAVAGDPRSNSHCSTPPLPSR